MDYLWVFLMLFAQLCWVSEIYIDKYLLNQTSKLIRNDSVDDTKQATNSVGTLVLVSAFFNIVVAGVILATLALYYGVDGAIAHITFEKGNLFSALSVGVMEVLWLIPYFYALHYADEITAPPVFQTIPIFGFALGFFFFEEIPTQIQVIAGLTILFGSVLLNMELLKEKAEEKGRLTFNWIAVALILLASFIIALCAFLFKGTGQEQNYWGTAFWTGIGAFLTGVCIWACIPNYRKQFAMLIRGRNRKVWQLNVTNEVVDNIARLTFFGAVMLGPSTALVQSMNAFQPILLLLFGFVLARVGSVQHSQKLTNSVLIRRSIAIMIIAIGTLLIFV